LRKGIILISAWVTVLLVTILTLIIASKNVLKEPLRELLIVIEGAVIAELSLIELSKRLGEPTILFEPCHKMKKVGFSVKVKDKPINDARVTCNGVPIPWEELDSTELPSKKLQVGARAYFFPFHIEIENRAVTEEGQTVEITLYQNKSENDDLDKPRPFDLAFGRYIVPRGTFEPVKCKELIKPNFEVNIRMTGDEIGHEVDRYFGVTFWPVMSREIDSDKFEDIEFAGLGLSATEKRRFGKNLFVNDIDVELLRCNFRMRRKEEEEKSVTKLKSKP
jgi:hypothetical protein